MPERLWTNFLEETRKQSSSKPTCFPLYRIPRHIHLPHRPFCIVAGGRCVCCRLSVRVRDEYYRMRSTCVAKSPTPEIGRNNTPPFLMIFLQLVHELLIFGRALNRGFALARRHFAQTPRLHTVLVKTKGVNIEGDCGICASYISALQSVVYNCKVRYLVWQSFGTLSRDVKP